MTITCYDDMAITRDIDTLMSRGNGGIRHAYLCILDAIQIQARHQRSSQGLSLLLTTLKDINDSVLGLSVSNNGLYRHKVERYIATIVEGVKEMMYVGAIDSDEMKDILTVFIVEFTEDIDVRNTMLTELDDAPDWRNDQSDVDMMMLPLVPAIIGGFSHSSLRETALRDDNAFEDYCMMIAELLLWDRKWSNPFFMTYADMEYHCGLQSWLLEMVSAGHLSMAEALSYAAEVSVVDNADNGKSVHMRQGPGLAEKISDQVGRLTLEQQGIVARTMGYAVSNLYHGEMVDVGELFSYVREVDIVDMLPASLLLRLVVAPVELSMVERSRLALDVMGDLEGVLRLG